MAQTETTTLQQRIEGSGEAAGAKALAVAFHDYETQTSWSYRGDRWFHAASTIKVPILVGVLATVFENRYQLSARVHVRNRFLSVADAQPYRVEASRDANAEVQRAIGRTMRVEELAYHMIVTSSNLATNLLVDLVGIEALQETLGTMGVEGVELRRGVEDERAYEAGISNRVTANGLLRVLRLIQEGRAGSVEASAKALEILHEQRFRSGIPAGVPGDTPVANKTGEISTIAHDAGIVYPRGRRPYALAVLTEWDAKTSGRNAAIAGISTAIYEHLTGEEGGDA
jgi:beta-lactamase class A